MGKTAVPLKTIKRESLKHLYELVSEKPDIEVPMFYDWNSGLNIPSGKLGDILSEENIQILAEKYAVKQRNIGRKLKNNTRMA